MKMSAGKLAAMRRLAKTDARFKMAAVAQRPPLLKALGIETVKTAVGVFLFLPSYPMSGYMTGQAIGLSASKM